LFGQSQDSLPAPAASLNPGPAQPFLFGSGPNTAAPSFAFGAAPLSTALSTGWFFLGLIFKEHCFFFIPNDATALFYCELIVFCFFFSLLLIE
jgi:hypothetical protein